MINDTNIHKQVINSITFPIIIIDEHKLIKMVNSAAEDFFKLSSKVLLEKSIESILPFSSPILSLIDNSLNTETTLKEYRVDLSTPISGSHKDVDVVCIALPNNLHEEAVQLCCKHNKAVLCTKPLGRNASEAKRMVESVEKAGIFAGYLEDLCYTPKFLKALDRVKGGSLGEIIWSKSRETHPGPHSEWFWDIEQAGGGCILDLGCHCIEISRNYIGKDIKPIEVMCWGDTQVKPIDAEDHAIGLVKYENGAIGQFEVSWTFRGGMDLRDEVMGTEGTIWINSFLRTGFEMFTTGKGSDYVAEKAE